MPQVGPGGNEWPRRRNSRRCSTGSDTQRRLVRRAGRIGAKARAAFPASNPAAVPLIVLVLAILIFGLTIGGKFFSTYTLTLILQQIAVVGILGAAQTLVILTAGIDLSIGVVMVISAVVMGNFAVSYGLPAPSRSWSALCVGALCGLLNGALVAYMKLPPFIVTLGTWNIIMATNFIYSANETIREADVAAQAPLLHLFGTSFRVGGAVLTLGVIAMVAARAGALVRAQPHRLGAARLCGRRRSRGGQAVRHRDQEGAAHGLCPGWTDRRLRRLGCDRPQRLGLAVLGGDRLQFAGNHRDGDRRHLAVRRARLDPRHAVRRDDRRRRLHGAATCWAPTRNGKSCSPAS